MRLAIAWNTLGERTLEPLVVERFFARRMFHANPNPL